MKEIKVYQRTLSYGEIRDNERKAAVFAKKQQGLSRDRRYSFVKSKDHKPGFKELSYGVTDDKVERMLDA